MSQLIVCGQGHGVACVYDGLRDAGVSFVFCTPDEALRARAQQDGVTLVDSYLQSITSADDLVLTAAYKPKIPGDHLAQCKFLNIHYALLPRYRGMHAIVWSILNGEKEVGFSIHETSVLLDQGAIVYQERMPIDTKTSWELMEAIDFRVRATVAPAVEGYRSGSIKPVQQIEEDAIFVAPRNREDCRVRWAEWDTVFFRRALQALVLPYPRPFFEYKGKVVEIEKAEIIDRAYYEIPGHVVYVDATSVWVKIPGGLVRLYRIVVDGQSMDAHMFFKYVGLRLVPPT